MNARPISPQQAAAEQFVHDRIDMLDANVLLDYATFVEQELDSEPVRNLLLGILLTHDRQWRFALAEVATHNRSLAAALKDLGELVEKRRAAFMEFRAIAMINEAKGEQA